MHSSLTVLQDITVKPVLSSAVLGSHSVLNNRLSFASYDIVVQPLDDGNVFILFFTPFHHFVDVVYQRRVQKFQIATWHKVAFFFAFDPYSVEPVFSSQPAIYAFPWVT